LKGANDLKLRRPVRDGKRQVIDVDTVRAALREQLGLDLIPALRSIEFLIVEKTTASASVLLLLSSGNQAEHCSRAVAHVGIEPENHTFTGYLAFSATTTRRFASWS
jgi:hypothetical protein